VNDGGRRQKKRSSGTPKPGRNLGSKGSVNKAMVARLEALEKPFIKLRELTGHFSRTPSIEEVHQLRIQARRLEAISAVLQVVGKRDIHRLVDRLLDEVSPIRKAAGKVRDLDVLVALALTLLDEIDKDLLVRLIEYLGALRTEAAYDLHDAVERHRKHLRRDLKRCRRWVQERFPIERTENSSAPVNCELSEAVTVIKKLTHEMTRWPRLGPANLHRFRIEVKRLHDVLQLFVPDETKFISALDEVKDQIGDWHDWRAFTKTVSKVLEPKHGVTVILHARAEKKLRCALSSANAMRSQYRKIAANPRSTS
jgi:CHAD domain-containing protein